VQIVRKKIVMNLPFRLEIKRTKGINYFD
jgi:hypothetical protein